MRTADVRGRFMKYVYGILISLYLCAPVYAFTPAQVPLLSAAAVPPNLMLLVDDSGSMNNIIWSSSFDPADTTLPTIYNCQGNLYGCQVVTADNVLMGNLYNSSCNNFNSSSYLFYNVSTGNTVCLKLPDPVGGRNTYYTAKYLSWLVKTAGSNYRDYTTGSIPLTYRMGVAKSVAANVVLNNQAIRIGLAALNPANGNKIVRAVSDITVKANYDALQAAITSLDPDGGTPLAQTYYEITRYFRGMSSAYASRVNYTSPIQYRCQKNYGVVVTDGLPSVDRSFPQSDDTDAAGKLPNWDGINNDGPRTGSNADGDTLYLDDLAKFAYDIDMRKPTSTPALDLASKSWDATGFVQQNMTTYTVGFTVSNQMLIDAATYGHGQYYQANDSAGLTDALNGALSDINAKAGSGGGGAANSTTLTTGSRFYQTLYDPSDWHGTVRAYNLDSSGNLSAAVWSTDTKIVNTATAPVYQSFNTATSLPITLNYTNFSTAQQSALTQTIPAGTALQYGITGTDLINWAKGTAKNGLRPRTRLLGDIVSSPLAAALPSNQTAADLVGDATYTAYLTTKAAGMNSNLLVNANDGFMHVINPDDGTQRYAYMPSTVLPSLITVSDPDYGQGMHKFTLDGQISIFDTQLDAGGNWQTVALGGTGAGGKAYYAIQLAAQATSGTTSTINNTINALWEIKAPDANTPANDFNDLGYAYSKPDVARMADGTGIAVLGNGYGSYSGSAALFVVNIKTGKLIRKIPIPPLPTATGESDNGLSSVKLRVNAQNVVVAAYAGDLKGRLWKFDLSGATADTWKVAFSNKPLFTAPRGADQPITVQPLLLDHPLNGKLVYFGTGKFLETADKQTTAQQDFYAIWDADQGAGNIVETGLQIQQVTGSVTGNGNTYFTSTTNDVDWSTKKGWYMPLATASPYLGERIIYPAQTSRGRIIFTTASVNSSDPCESTGTGRLFELDAAKGGMLNYQVLDTNGDNDISIADTLVSGLAVNTGIPTLASIISGTSGANDNKYLLDSSGGAPIKILEKGGTANTYQRIMWRQIQ